MRYLLAALACLALWPLLALWGLHDQPEIGHL